MSQIASIASPVLGASRDTADLLLKVAGVAGFAVLTALAAQASFPLPGTPVPVTLQTLSVTLAAFTLGPRLGAVSMALYFGLALGGVPVLADGNGGVRVALGATGGYLIGFILAQPVMALAARRGGSAGGNGFGGASGLIVALVLGNLVIFGCGVLWLALYLKLDWPAALAQGLWPFLPGTVVKSAAAFLLGFALVPWSVRRGW